MKDQIEQWNEIGDAAMAMGTIGIDEEAVKIRKVHARLCVETFKYGS